MRHGWQDIHIPLCTHVEFSLTMVSSMKSASVKPSSEQKTNANGVAKQNPTPSTSCKSAGHGSDGSAESLTAAQVKRAVNVFP